MRNDILLIEVDQMTDPGGLLYAPSHHRHKVKPPADQADEKKWCQCGLRGNGGVILRAVRAAFCPCKVACPSGR